ncbi:MULTISPECIES: OsmC family protein [unclassified Gemella]|uniref:OsmC family protein n=1 Tax=unclassified Gemella TaxID=2624949 RepID=UPI001C042252|nr:MULTISPECIES: OsmC family protein [unclassified Gemella]MBU0278972.1 OsmC family protein [Gemella sp. zg-1178]QWQ39078.1 OsmC family protein [Gemella sp. zg-570]
MYKVKSKLDKGFDVFAKSSNEQEYVLKMTEADGPMDVFTVAFSGCILMCSKGYFFRKYEILDLSIEIDLSFDYENRAYHAEIKVDYPDLTKEDIEGIIENIKLRCKISHLLSDDVKATYEIIKK